MKVEHALIRVQIEALHTEFAWRIDRGDPSTVADLFTADGCYSRSTGESSIGQDAIRMAYAARTNRGPRTARHIFSNLRLHDISNNAVKGACILTLFAEDGLPPRRAEPLLIADYDDEFLYGADGVWRFKSRLITWIFTRPEGGLGRTLPLGSKL